MTDPVDRSMYCRVCRLALNLHQPPSGARQYLHAQRADHQPDPVPLAELKDAIQKCDFCSSRAAYVYECDNQSTTDKVVTKAVVGQDDYRRRHHAARARRVETARSVTANWGERWTACADCAATIEIRDLLALVARVMEALPGKFRKGNALIRTRAKLRDEYEGVFATLKPGRYRITPDNPLGVWESFPPSP